MKQHRISAALVAIVAGVVLASADTLLANGESFFIPAGGRHVDLAYFARDELGRSLFRFTGPRRWKQIEKPANRTAPGLALRLMASRTSWQAIR